MIRAVVDTNVWVSAFLNPYGFPSQILDALKSDQFEPVTSEILLEELLDVLSRPRLVKKYELEPEDIAEFHFLLEQKSIKVYPKGEVYHCRDPRDDVLLETAILSHSKYIVSRDDDVKRDLKLIHMMQELGVTILSVSRFLKILE